MEYFEKHVCNLSDEKLEKLEKEFRRLAKAEEFYNMDFGTMFHEKFDIVMSEVYNRMGMEG